MRRGEEAQGRGDRDASRAAGAQLDAAGAELDARAAGAGRAQRGVLLARLHEGVARKHAGRLQTLPAIRNQGRRAPSCALLRSVGAGCLQLGPNLVLRSSFFRSADPPFPRSAPGCHDE